MGGDGGADRGMTTGAAADNDNNGEVVPHHKCQLPRHQHQRCSNGNGNGMLRHNCQLPTATPTTQKRQCQWPMPTPCHVTTANCQPPITNIRQCHHVINTNDNEVATPTPMLDANAECQCQHWMLALTPDDDTSLSCSNAGGFFLSFNLCAG